MKLIVGIPTINRADLLNDALIKYFEDFENTEIFIIDNGNQNIITREKKFAIYRPENNLGVAKSWNTIMDYADRIKATHVLMLNDDVYLGKKEALVFSLVVSHVGLPFINSEMNWCSFILSVRGWKQAGKFDEEYYPAYFEDNSFCYKMRLKEMHRYNTPILNPVIYRNSQSIEKNPSLNNNFMQNRQLYIDMWGGLPNEEKFKTKFNK